MRKCTFEYCVIQVESTKGCSHHSLSSRERRTLIVDRLRDLNIC